MIRFEILLPLFYNDGRPIERDKFLQTDDELVQLFGATSTDTVVVRGRWLYQSTLYHDQLIRVRLDADGAAPMIDAHIGIYNARARKRAAKVDKRIADDRPINL